MFQVYFSTLVGCICTCIVSGYAEFYYMVPPPSPPTPASTYYSTSFGNNAPYQFAPQATSFISRSFGPPQAYYTTHQTFGSVASPQPPLPYHTFTSHTPSNILSPVNPAIPQQTFAHTPTATVFSTGATDQYRGFAYHTQSNNGASTNVFFLTGPEAHQIRHLQSFASNSNESDASQKARKLASDIVASNATEKNNERQIIETLAGPPPGSPFDAIRSIFQNPQLGFQQFYSSNGQLFSRTVQDANLNLPANTLLLQTPISVRAFEQYDINPRFKSIENVTSANGTKEKSDDKGEEVAESMIDGVRVKPNNTDEHISTAVEISTKTTSAISSTEIVSTTKETEKLPVTNDPATPKEARSIKQETKAKKETNVEKLQSTTLQTEMRYEEGRFTTVKPTKTSETVTKQLTSTIKKA